MSVASAALLQSPLTVSKEGLDGKGEAVRDGNCPFTDTLEEVRGGEEEEEVMV